MKIGFAKILTKMNNQPYGAWISYAAVKMNTVIEGIDYWMQSETYMPNQ